MDEFNKKVVHVVESFISQSLKELPEEFSKKIENVEFIVEFWPNQNDIDSIKLEHGRFLFGLYKGVPKTKRTSGYSSLPDKITIYAGPILSISRNWQEVFVKVRSTLLHEIGHHFGMSDKQIYSAMGI